MSKRINFNNRCLSKLFLAIMLCFSAFTIMAQRLPYTIENNSEFQDNEVFVAVVGEELPGGKFIWVDPANGQINRMSRSDNTIQGPIIGGNQGPGLNGKYANCFRRLTEIPNKTINIPQIAGCRILISFKSQMYLYFFGYDGAPSGYAGANLANPTDPNQGITFEVIELTFNEFGIFNNTSRVDAFQYPIGLEVEGQGFFKKVGELKTRNEIFDRWEQQAPVPFKRLLDREKGIISFPMKDESFPKDYLDSYINAIWNKYKTQEIYFNSGDAGRWRGSVQPNGHFVLRRESDGQTATIFGKPSTLEAMEGSGVMARGDRWDLVIQAQFVAAITRHAIDLNSPSGEFQDFGDTSRYYQVEPYNWYAKFLHQTDISFEGQTYAFAYDDVFDQSATIATPNPIRAKITLGPINGNAESFNKRIEAEDYQAMSGVQTEPCSEGGLNVGYIDAGDWMSYGTIDFPFTGTYRLEYRVASAVGGGKLSSDLNAGATVLGELDIPDTGGWQNWITVSQKVNITSGAYPFGLFAQSGGWNVNWINIQYLGSSRISEDNSNKKEPNIQNLKIYPNPVSTDLYIAGADTNTKVTIVNLSGQVIEVQKEINGSQVVLDISGIPAGIYFLKISQKGKTAKAFQFIKK
ncbi:beta-1,3-glucanase family protein [Aquimarina celericrescens]|uniref:Beta-1,3-glucanase family protein n=1 Tax=Aquimarina celericrescens TaxID=1964542 RepID=A0ABW5AWH7_9FLAO|nr:carbohydrate-binding protein [Aquimarina celericrescens]